MTVTTIDNTTTMICDATDGAITQPLPAAAGKEGTLYRFKKTDATANAVTIDGNGAETIDGAATYVLHGQYDSVTIVSDGTEWHIV